MENEEMLENICTLVDLMERVGCQLEALARHAGLMNKSLQEMIGDTKSINQNMQQAGLGLKALADAATKADEAPTEALEVQAALDKGDKAIAAKMSKPVHLNSGNGFALCGAMGTVSQPFMARLNDPVVLRYELVTCPECLAKMAARKKS